MKTNRSVLDKDNDSLLYDSFLEVLKRSIRENKTVVVDEFHRLGNDFFDLLHSIEKKGRLILVSSTLNLSKKLLSEKSPLLGLFAEFQLDIINLEDVLKALYKKGIKDKKTLLELGIIMREPITVDYFEKETSSRKIISKIILSSKKTIPALIGEVFYEETKTLTPVYEGILRAIALGKGNSGDISSYLYSRKLIKKDDPSIIQQYINNLISFGFIKRIEFFNKKRFSYKHISPLIRIYYYLDEKYNISEREIEEKELIDLIDKIMPFVVEDEVRSFLVRKYGMIENKYSSPDLEIDGILKKFKKPQIALEVKWKKPNKQDIKKSEQNLSQINSERRILFTLNKKNVPKTNLEVFDVLDLIK